MDENRIGKQIKEFRKMRGLTQMQLAELCGLDNKTRISQIESGYRVPSISDTLPRICEALGVDFDVILTEKR